MANQLFGFSPEAFEQFVRALAISVFGPGVTAFGNGPDGGREATFRGEVPYPYPPANKWAGYGVIQAKCKEKAETSEKDQKWALKLLGDELKLFVKSGKRDPKPEYYIFVTNVELSSAANGGRDEAEKLVCSYYRTLPLKGHAVWDANQLSAFLTQYGDLRRRFTAHLTPGDVLGTMLADIERRRPNSTRILTGFLERELRADEASRLDQAGNRTEEQLRLAHLFFDLPASAEPQLLPPSEDLDANARLPHGVLWELLRDGSRKLDPKTLYEQETSSAEETTERLPARYVLLGGPGSGKSTVGQFLAQIHRSALLATREPHLLDPQTRQIIQETRELCDNEGLPWPTTPRYPFRIELNRLAKALASSDADRVESLERYLLNAIKREHTMTHEHLLEWLAAYPWLLILDGLDEVPATSNRDALVTAVNDFLAEARQAEADLFVVATSRQQGYAGEFSSGVVAFRHVLPLSRVRALRYVERYANARFGMTDPVRAKDVVDKLRDSAKRELTAQLMASPLQVTFMATVVAARGDPGEDRWQLFDSYYRTIYDRERQKAVPPYDAVLSKQQPTIDRLHHDIGFWLQHRGEMVGGTAVSLPIGQFEQLVDAYLLEIGREGAEKDEMVKLITGAARHRLVFLTSRVAEELSFDVRSLQEYMAAECIMTGDPDLVRARLKAIAPTPYWRNVFLFAASKCFLDARSRHLQDSIRLLCEDMNSPSDVLLDATKAGSELAIDVLQSGAVAENPNHARHLARVGLGLLCEPYVIRESEEGVAADQRLTVVYSEALKTVYRDTLTLRVGQVDLDRTIGSWPLLIRLIDAGVDWAVDLGNSSWPTERKAQMVVVGRVPQELLRISWLWNNITKMIWLMGPLEASSVLGIIRTAGSESEDESDPFNALFRVLERRKIWLRIPLRLSPEDQTDFSVAVAPAFSRDEAYTKSFELLARLPHGHPGWLPFILASEFLKSPDARTLANVLNQCVKGCWSPSDKCFLNALPWPFANCLNAAESLEALRRLSVEVEKGALGDSRDWEAIEARWKSEGITLDAFVRRPAQGLVVDEATGFLGLPSNLQWSITHRDYPDSIFQKLATTASGIKDSTHRNMVMWFLCVASSHTGGIARCIKPAEFKTLWAGSEGKRKWYENHVGYPDKPELIPPWLEFFDWIGRSDDLAPRYGSHDRKKRNCDDAWCDIFQKAFISGREEHGLMRLFGRGSNRLQIGLLRLLGRLASNGYAVELIPSEMLRLELFSEPKVKLASILVRLSQANLNEKEAGELAEQAAILIYPPAEPGADSLVFRTAEAHLKRVPAIGIFLIRLHERMPAKVEFGLANCERLLRHVLRKRASDLQVSGELERLKLPVVNTAAPLLVKG